MTDNEKKMLNSISPAENSIMCAMIAGDRLEKIRGICKESFRMNDTGCEGLHRFYRNIPLAYRIRQG